MKHISYLYLSIFVLFFSVGASAQQSSIPSADNPQVSVVEKNTVVTADFKSDGCTLWFDGNFRDCCIQHDLDYWNWYKTGGWRGRLRADNRLFTCIAGKGFFQKGMAPFMWLGVRVFGSPLFPAQKGNVIYNASKKVIRFFRKGGGQASNKRKIAPPSKASVSRNLKSKPQTDLN